MELNEALSQISEIRRQIASTEVFRGYRSATTAFSSGVALVACAIHRWCLPDDINAYLWLWLVAATVSLCVVGTEMVVRSSRSKSSLQREMTLIAVEQFLPCLVAGGLLTYVMLHFAFHSLWMLPGLWAVLFSLGVFSSRRVLPRGTAVVGAWYLLSGILCIVLTSSPLRQVPAPWEMAACFGVGQAWLRSCCFGTWSVIMPSKENKSVSNTERDRDSGRFAYEGLERVLHEKSRLSILSSLSTHVDGLIFNDLKAMCSLTDGNLSRQLQVLQEAGLIEILKGYKNNRPQTQVRLTPDGRQRFLDYIAVLESVVADAAAATKQTGKLTLPFKGMAGRSVAFE